jgi:predicted enzyme related to lactoylglutathione lyase
VGTLVIFAVNVPAVADFYKAVIGLSPCAKAGDNAKDLRLCNANEEILIHSIPKRISKNIVIESPPKPREDCAMKPVFDVASLSDSLKQVSLKGGVVTEQTFTLDGLTRRDVLDPEGNVFQLRSPLS